MPTYQVLSRSAMFRCCAVLVIGLLSLLSSLNVKATDISSTKKSNRMPTFKAEQLTRDLSLFAELMKAYHPGLYRYQTEAEFEQQVDALRQQLTSGANLAEAYLAISQLAATIRCGHTFTNPYNQREQVKSLILNAENKFPVVVERINNRYFVAYNQHSKLGISQRDELVSINDRPMAELIEAMLPFVASDGHNLIKRYHRLDMNIEGGRSLFDVYLPIISPPKNGEYLATFRSQNSNQPYRVKLGATSWQDRKKQIADSGEFKKPANEGWEFKLLDEQTGYFKFSSFATFNMDLDWQSFLQKGFEQLAQSKANSLVIDIRGNGGGMGEVSDRIISYLIDAPLKLDRYQERVRYKKVAPAHRSYVGTWNEAVYDITKWIDQPKGDMYSIKTTAATRLMPSAPRFSGKVYLLIDGGNNSATTTMAKLMRQYQLATLIGSEQGGNLKGINGGQMFFFTLPETNIEVDIPLIGYFPSDDQPDRGIIPDHRVEQTVEDWYQGKDTVLAYVEQLIDSQ